MAKLRGAEVLDLSSFRPETVRGRAGFCRVGKTKAGQWWFLDAGNRPFWLKAVAGGGDDEAARGRSWGVNTATVPWNADVGAGQLMAMVDADFGAAGAAVIRSHGVRLPDVFDGGWSAACETRTAEIGRRWAGRAEVVGVFTDDALGWGEPRAGRPSLLQVCLSLEPRFAAYHSAWEFVLAQHGGDFGVLTRAWGVDWVNREGVRRRTVADEALASAGYLRDQDRFAREFARRYFTTTAEALRRHDPDHLVLGCRFAQPPGAAVLAECGYPRVDVVSWRCGAEEWAAGARGYLKTDTNPQLLTGFVLGEERARAVPVEGRGGPTRLERRLRDGRRALMAACEHPGVVGYEWARWADGEDDQPPFGKGLVHVDGREALENTELVAQVNARAERLRAAKAGLSLIK